MKKAEAEKQVLFGKYIREKKLIGHFELKYVYYEKPFHFRSFKKQQIGSLAAAQQSNFYWKYSDLDIRTKPFDCSNIPPLPGYVVIFFKNNCYVIPVEKILSLMIRKVKSLTEQEAESCCELKVIF